MTARLLAALPLFAAATPAAASVTFAFAQLGNDVTLTASGSLNLTGNALIASGGGSSGYIAPSVGQLAAGSFASIDAYRLSSISGPFGTRASRGANFNTGSIVGIDVANLAFYVPVSYVSGSALLATATATATATFTGATFASLGLTPGSYVSRTPNDTITIATPAAVPEPAAWATMVVGLGLASAALRRRPAHASA